MRAEGWVFKQDFDDAFGGMAIPEGRDAAGLAFSGEDVLCGGENFGGVGADEDIGAFGDGDGAFGIFAKRQAGDAEGGGFFLDAAGIGEDEGGFAEKAEKIEIADGRDQL